MTEISLTFRGGEISARLPEGSETLRMAEASRLGDPGAALAAALASPIGTPAFARVAAERLARAKAGGRAGRACIVVSDGTRPVPYRGEGGILRPLLSVLLAAGFAAEDICLLVATGTHRPMGRGELEAMLGPEVLGLGVQVANHDCRDEAGLVDLGRTARGTWARINRRYVEADLKVLTGLVENHFMAGASGGRKAICPGIMGEEGTRVFHGAPLMAHPASRDLNLEGNPVHEESLAVARLAGSDFIVNVTLDREFRPTGYFCGELEAAHAAAVERLRSCVGIEVERPYDIVVSHGGFVAVNHYQAAKAAVAAMGALAPGAGLVLLADNHDPDPLGSERYRSVLSLLRLVGPRALERILASPDWTFIPEQWQVQMWAKAFRAVSMEDFVYFAPQLDDRDWKIVPGTDGRRYLPRRGGAAAGMEDAPAVIEGAVAELLARKGFTERDVATGRCRIAYLVDGPYGIPFRREAPAAL